MILSNRYKQVVRFSLFLCVTVVLFWWVYKDQDWTETFNSLKHDVDYTWIVVGAILGILSHVARALRWQLLTGSMGYKLSLPNSFFAVMVGYFANMLIPRMGEVSRCGVITKYEGIPFAKLLGTVVTERVIDLFILLLFTLLMVVTQFHVLVRFFKNNSEILNGFDGKVSIFSSGTFWVVVVAFIFCVFLGVYLIRRTSMYGHIILFLKGLKDGVLSIKQVDKKWLFVFYSLFIWVMYFLMLYVSFFCFNFSSGLGLGVALTVFVLSSYGMVAPVQGGVGAWHFMVIASLMLYLPHTATMQADARTFAFLTHGSMTMLYIVVGALSLLALPIYNRYRK